MIITTKYQAATDTRGPRIVAVVEGGQYGKVKAWIPYRGDVSTMEMHQRAAIAVATKAGLRGWWLRQEVVVGETDTGYVHVPIVDPYKPIAVV
jgi:hypothetical protein